jgi:hypothetical protein
MYGTKYDIPSKAGKLIKSVMTGSSFVNLWLGTSVLCTYIEVCMYVYTYVCIYVCMHVCFYTGWSKSLCASDYYSKKTTPTQLIIWRWQSQNTFGMWTVLFWTRYSRTQFGVSINVWRLAGDNLNITCNFLHCDYQVHRDFLITLYMYMYMYVCVHVCIMCVHVCMYVCTYIYMYIYIYYVCVYEFVNI